MKNYWHFIEDDLRAQTLLGVGIWVWEELYELNELLSRYADFTEKHGL